MSIRHCISTACLLDTLVLHVLDVFHRRHPSCKGAPFVEVWAGTLQKSAAFLLDTETGNNWQ